MFSVKNTAQLGYFFIQIYIMKCYKRCEPGDLFEESAQLYLKLRTEKRFLYLTILFLPWMRHIEIVWTYVSNFSWGNHSQKFTAFNIGELRRKKTLMRGFFPKSSTVKKHTFAVEELFVHGVNLVLRSFPSKVYLEVQWDQIFGLSSTYE